jgi:hypothetical protein
MVEFPAVSRQLKHKWKVSLNPFSNLQKLIQKARATRMVVI